MYSSMSINVIITIIILPVSSSPAYQREPQPRLAPPQIHPFHELSPLPTNEKKYKYKYQILCNKYRYKCKWKYKYKPTCNKVEFTPSTKCFFSTSKSSSSKALLNAFMSLAWCDEENDVDINKNEKSWEWQTGGEWGFEPEGRPGPKVRILQHRQTLHAEEGGAILCPFT